MFLHLGNDVNSLYIHSSFAVTKTHYLLRSINCTVRKIQNKSFLYFCCGALVRETTRQTPKRREFALPGIHARIHNTFTNLSCTTVQLSSRTHWTHTLIHKHSHAYSVVLRVDNVPPYVKSENTDSKRSFFLSLEQ